MVTREKKFQSSKKFLQTQVEFHHQAHMEFQHFVSTFGVVRNNFRITYSASKKIVFIFHKPVDLLLTLFGQHG